MSAAVFEQRVIQAIQSGDLQELKKCCISKSDVNRCISLSKDIPVISASKQCPFPTIRAPTPLVYSILCEQPELLDYLLRVKSPDLSVRVNGWAPIHYAACTGSHRCLEILLSYKYTQVNIDMPVVEPVGVTRQEKMATTALHIAVTNKRHAAALLLTQDLNPPKFDENGQPVDSATVELRSPANAKQMSTYGNMPLHIAARQNDWDMCQILLHASGMEAVDMRNKQNKTAVDIAREFGFSELEAKLSRGELETIEELKFRYLESDGVVARDSGSDEEHATSSEIKEVKRQLLSLTDCVRRLIVRVEALEARRYESVSAEAPRVTTVNSHQCRRCGCSADRECTQCSFFYCNTCWSKPPHSCAVHHE